MIRKLALSALILAVMTYPAMASTPEVVASWTAPTTGSPVVVYQLAIFADSEALPVIEAAGTSYVFGPSVLEWGTVYTARVRGVDAQGRAGPWSEWSDELVLDQGAPGGCGRITWTVGE